MAYGKLVFIKPRNKLHSFIASFFPFGVFSSVGIEYNGAIYTGNKKKRARKSTIVYSKWIYLSDSNLKRLINKMEYSYFNKNCVYKIKPILIENGFGWKWYYRMPNFLYKAVKDKKEMESYWFIY
jgi:hypothetical protein